MIKKADIALFFIILIFGIIISFVSLFGNSEGDEVKVAVDGQLFGIYDINTDQTIEVKQDNHINHITIKDGMVSMSYSDCANQVCVHSGAISMTKDSIVCLPNKVMIEIIAKNRGGDVDVISG